MILHISSHSLSIVHIRAVKCSVSLRLADRGRRYRGMSTICGGVSLGDYCWFRRYRSMSAIARGVYRLFAVFVILQCIVHHY